MKFTPRPYQAIIRNFALDNPRANVFASMGMGKSAATIDTFDSLRLQGEAKRLLIIAPKRVAKNTWPREIEKWHESFGHLKIAAAIGTEAERIAACRSGADITTINYDNIPWLVAKAGNVWPWDMVVADECFVADTPISTRNGTTRIDQLAVGDEVLTRMGFKKVTRVYEKSTLTLVEVRLVNGTRIVCTGRHLFWTTTGWKEAAELDGTATLYPAVSALRSAICHPSISNNRPHKGEVLRCDMQVSGSDGSCVKGGTSGTCGLPAQLAEGTPLLERRRANARDDQGETEPSFVGPRPDPEGAKGWQWTGYERGRGDECRDAYAGVGLEYADQHQRTNHPQPADKLQTRLRVAGMDDLPRGGWSLSQGRPCAGNGCEKDNCNCGFRVVGVSNIECRSPVPIWDLEVEGAHEFFAGGVLVHNCTRLKGLRVSMQRRKLQDGTLGKPFLAGQGSSRAKALAQVAHKHVKRWLNLTGSPAPNGVVDLWGQMWFIDGGQRLGNSFTAYSHRYFRAVPGSDGYSNIEPMPFSQQQIEALIKDCCVTIDAKDWFDIKDPIERIVRIELPPAARKQYKQMEKELFAEVMVDGRRQEVEAFNAGSKSNKCLQFASGNVFYDDKGSWASVHDEKIEALKSIVEETNGEPLLVRYCFRPELERIMKAFPRAKFFDDKRQTEDDWNAGKYQMLVTHAASAGHGSNLQDGGRILVDFSSGWNLEEDEQIIERIGPMRQLQSGHDRAVFRYRIVAGDTLEETAVLPRIRTKASVQDSLKAAMKIGA